MLRWEYMKQTFFCLLLFFTCFPAFADQEYHYVDPALISPEFISSPVENEPAVIEDIIKRQSALTSAEKDEISGEGKMRSDILALNERMTRKAYPNTYILLDKVGEDCKEAVSLSKQFYNTKRPYQTDKRIKSYAYWPGNASYPSGHTACSRVMAEVLGQLSPANRAKFRARATAIAEHRVMGGVHWPQDLVGGEQLGLLFFGALQTSEAYRRDLENAKPEWKY